MEASSTFDVRWPMHQPHYDFVQHGGLLRPVPERKPRPGDPFASRCGIHAVPLHILCLDPNAPGIDPTQ